MLRIAVATSAFPQVETYARGSAGTNEISCARHMNRA
jgi:hypothetical protein